jgi:hypothetical protein
MQHLGLYILDLILYVLRCAVLCCLTSAGLVQPELERLEQLVSGGRVKSGVNYCLCAVLCCLICAGLLSWSSWCVVGAWLTCQLSSQLPTMMMDTTRTQSMCAGSGR